MNQVYAYDSFGNILQNGSFNSTYTASNQMFGYAYDAAGNQLSNGLFDNMTWDADSRLTSVGGATYIYDAEGNRVEKQGAIVTDTIYFAGQPIARLTAGQWTDLIYGPTGLLAEVPGTQAGSPVYRLTDNLGTGIGSLLANGSFVDAIDHSPFGQVVAGTTNDPYFFTGKERDAESGLDYFGARYYGSNMGRWMSPDWSAKEEPVPYAKLDDPQSLNLYAYVGNNPLSRADLDGHIYNGGSDSAGDPDAGWYQKAVALDRQQDAQKVPQTSDSITVTAKNHWWNRWFSKISAAGIAIARFGRLGGPAHRAAVARVAKQMEAEGFRVTFEKFVRTPGGEKSWRFIDVYGEKGTSNVVEIRETQVGRANVDGSPVAREARALNDIEEAPDNRGIRPNFVNYGAPEIPTPPMIEEEPIEPIP